jgi:polysaccharide export outer membrane protein
LILIVINYICGATSTIIMNRLLLLTGVLLCVLSTSCIPLKDTIYLQEKNTAIDTTQVMVEQQKPYRVQINDILNIRLKVLDQENATIFNPVGEADLNATGSERAYFDGFTVDLHGSIRIPDLGSLDVLGFTCEEIEALIKERLLEDQFKSTANIFITVKLSGLRFTTSGEVGAPGTQVVYQERVNVFEAIANSGEIPITGDKKDVQIIRQYPQGQQIHHLDLTDIAVMKSPYYYIKPNDIIYVKPLKQKSWGTGITGVQTFTTVISILTILSTTLILITR